MNPRPRSLMIMESPKKVMPGHPKISKIQYVQITSLTGLMSAHLMNLSNVCGARPCFCAMIDHLSNEITCTGTILAEFPCPLRRTTYTTGCSPCPQRSLLRQSSQEAPLTFSIHGQGVGTAQRLSMPAHIAVLAAHSNINSCRI